MSLQDMGQFDHRVTIQQATESLGASRQPVKTWSTLTTAYMARRPGFGGQERFKAEQVSAAVTLGWVMRYTTSMDPDLVDVAKTRRLVYRNQVHDIVSAQVIGPREGIELATLASSQVTA